MRRLLVARAPTRWGRIPLTTLAVVAHLLLGLLVIGLRISRVIVTLATAAASRAEQTLAAHTGRPALSQTGIGVLTAAFIHEFRTAYHQPTTR